MHFTGQNPAARECDGASKTFATSQCEQVNNTRNPEQKQGATIAKGRILQNKNNVWCQARRIRNQAVLLTIKNSLKPAPAPYCKPLPSLKRLNELFIADFENGKLYCKKPRGGLKLGDECGTLVKGYIQVFADHVAYRAHRIMWKMAKGSDPSGQIDHANGEPSDNRIDNLRDFLPVQNSRNRNDKVKSNSGHRGVSWCSTSKRWLACIGAEDRTVHLGKYLQKSCAIKARKHAESILYDGGVA